MFRRPTAKDLGVSQSTLSRIETGQALPELLVVRRVAALVKKTPGELMDDLFEEAFREAERAASKVKSAPKRADPWEGLAALALAGLVAIGVAKLLSDDDE